MARTHRNHAKGEKRQLSEELGIDNDPAALKIGDTLAERDQRAFPAFCLDFEEVARAVILDRRNPSDLNPVAIYRRHSNQIDVIIFAFLKRGQFGAIDLHERAAQGLGRRTIGNAFKARDDRLSTIANGNKPALLASRMEFFVTRQAFNALREQLEAHFAFDAMRSSDRSEGDSALAAVAR